MSRKTLAAILGVIVIVVVVVIVFVQNKKDVSAMPADTATVQGSASQDTAAPSSTTPSSSSYTMAQVATHTNAASCWTTINGNVYDVTSWIKQHPGGSQAILSLCGNDGTAAFTAQHGGQGRPEAELASFKIGTLSK